MKETAMHNFKVKDARTGEMHPRTLWLCPVTLPVMDQYPQYFYGKIIK